MSIKGGMNKQSVLYTYKEIYYSHLEKRNSVIYYNMDKLEGIMIGQSQKEKYYKISLRCFEATKVIDKKCRMVFTKGKEEGDGVTVNEFRVSVLVVQERNMEMRVVMITQFYEYI